MRLQEVLGSPKGWNWIEQGRATYVAEFTVGAVRYEVFFNNDGGSPTDPNIPYWGVEFAAADQDYPKSVSLTGTGGELAVFSTVIDIVKSFLDAQRQDVDAICLWFDAATPTRRALYTRMVHRLTGMKPTQHGRLMTTTLHL